jgi:hypothetical protein
MNDSPEEKCLTCKFWKPDLPLSRSEMHFLNLDGSITREGWQRPVIIEHFSGACRRYPTQITRGAIDWCGEYSSGH